jgi:hypothetical protein
MTSKTATPPTREFAGLDEPLHAQLPTFELFFKTFGFKRVHGRVWGLLVLAGQPLTSREISSELSLSQGATSTCVNELTEWGAIKSSFDTTRRCHVHAPVGNTLSIVATVFRRREQLVFGKFKHSAQATLDYIRGAYGEKDPRVFTLRSIISSLEIAEAVMQLVFSSVERALGDSESILSRAVNTALKIGMKVPARLAGGSKNASAGSRAPSLSTAILHGFAPDEPAHDADAELEDEESDVDERSESASRESSVAAARERTASSPRKLGSHEARKAPKSNGRAHG